jgi:hypothetical protein
MDLCQPAVKRIKTEEGGYMGMFTGGGVGGPPLSFEPGAPLKEPWKLIYMFDSEAEMLAYFTNKVPRNAITHRNRSKCSLCKNMRENDDEHKMQVAYRSCTSKTCTDRCTVKFKVIMCENDVVYNCYKMGEHSLNDPSTDPHAFECLVGAPMHPQVKAYIHDLINMRIVIPRRILAHLKVCVQLFFNE